MSRECVGRCGRDCERTSVGGSGFAMEVGGARASAGARARTRARAAADVDGAFCFLCWVRRT